VALCVRLQIGAVSTTYTVRGAMVHFVQPGILR
jgi:hypothetical protein